MAKKSDYLTDAEVEKEIERLNNSEAVALAQKAIRLKNRRRQRLYQLRDFEKKLWRQELQQRCWKQCMPRMRRMSLNEEHK